MGLEPLWRNKNICLLCLATSPAAKALDLGMPSTSQEPGHPALPACHSGSSFYNTGHPWRQCHWSTPLLLPSPMGHNLSHCSCQHSLSFPTPQGAWFVWSVLGTVVLPSEPMLGASHGSSELQPAFLLPLTRVLVETPPSTLTLNCYLLLLVQLEHGCFQTPGLADRSHRTTPCPRCLLLFQLQLKRPPTGSSPQEPKCPHLWAQ